MAAPATTTSSIQPLALTHAEGQDLRRRLEDALAQAQDDFLKAHVTRDTAGTPIGGPNPSAVTAETLLVLARHLARAGFDLVNAAAFEEKIARLEAELTAAPSRQLRRGANWRDPGTAEACFWAYGVSELCNTCDKHIRDHYGGVEYRCSPRAEAEGTAPGTRSAPTLFPGEGLCGKCNQVIDTDDDCPRCYPR